MAKNYDFSGWATRNDLKCSDGRTIRRDAFKDCDGMKVPLCWGHHHDSPSDVLGHCLLENKEEGVYAYGYFNDSPAGQDAREAVRHGDIKALSIYANRLKQSAGDVLHGMIREVSLVYSGANPGAYIDNAVIAHGDGSYDLSEDEAIIFTGEELDVAVEHADEKEEKDMAEEKKETQTTQEASDERTVKDVFDEMTDEQKDVVYFMIGEALKDAGVEEGDEEEEEDVEHSDEYGGEDEMRYNAFDNSMEPETDTLSHDEMATIIGDIKKYGSLKESFLAHAEDYGIDQIDWLFPEPKNLNQPPEFIKRPDDWVSIVMSGVHHSPISRIKSTYADITEDEARARGYIKGKLKKEEVFGLLKRATTPTTVYKKQKLDRDDQIDITDFDVVAWLKAEMRGMLDEELAGAYLFGDGRLASSDDKINEGNIRPISKDADLFTIKYAVAPDDTVPQTAVTVEDMAPYYAKGFIKAAIKSRKGYKGSGNPVMFTSESMISEMLLLEDTIGHPLYKTEAELATKMRVSRIVTIPDEIIARGTYDGNPIMAGIVNLNDYWVGADKGGAINMFDDFDIDYNQMKYLIETRCSGALVKPFSAIVLYAGESTGRTSKIVGDEDFKAADLID